MIDPGIRRADARFVLPRHPSSAVVLEPDDGWAEALALGGVERSAPAAGSVDLVVAPAARVREAVLLGAPMILLEGPASVHPLRAAGYRVDRFLVLPDARRPEVILPLVHRQAFRYAVRRRVAGASFGRRLAKRAGAAGAAALPHLVRPAAAVTIASRWGRLPFPLASATALGLPGDVAWYLHLGNSGELAERRMAYLGFPRGADSPQWAVKMSRVQGMEAAFDREARGLELLREAAPQAAERAPRLLGRTSIDGLALSLESAAVGDRLTETLRRGGTRELPVVGAVSAWLVDLAKATRMPAADLASERVMLTRDVAPPWRGRAAVDELLGSLGDVSAVLVHSDMGTWNIVSAGPTFIVIDWESTRRAGLPLWDLIYFLADACAQMERRARPDQRVDYLLALFRGDAELSSLVFEWVRRGVEASRVAPESVGVIATLLWLYHAAPAVPTSPGGDVGAGDSPASVRFATRWLADPSLGPSWSAWR